MPGRRRRRRPPVPAPSPVRAGRRRRRGGLGAPGRGRGRGPAVTQLLHHPPQLRLALGVGPPEGERPLQHLARHPVGAQVGGGDRGDGQGPRSAERGPQAGRGGDGAGGEDHRRGPAEHRGDGRQQCGAHQLGPDADVGGRARGTRPARGRVGARSGAAVPPAVAAVRSRVGCAKLRHQRPRYRGHRGAAVVPSVHAVAPTVVGQARVIGRAGPNVMSPPLITGHTR